MEQLEQLKDAEWLLPLIMILFIWEMVWKIIAFWKAARNNHLAWYICIAVFNTVGILPIVYILKFGKKKMDVSE